MLFLVIDNNSSGILTRCVSASCANAVSKGILNSSTMVVKFPFMRNNHDINRYQDDPRLNFKLVRLYDPEKVQQTPSNWGGESNDYQFMESKDNKPFDLVFFDKKYITDDWIKKRKISNLRANHIRNLETICERYMARLKNFVADEIFMTYLSDQLNLSDHKTQTYPASIKEYAEISNMTPAGAFNELKMTYDSTGISIMRIHAIWNKYVDEINSFEKEEDIQNIYQRIETELIHGER
jgi:hypothetical protein